MTNYWVALFFLLALNAHAQESNKSENMNPNRGSSTGGDSSSTMALPKKVEAPAPRKWGGDISTEIDSAPEGSGYLGVPRGSTYIQNFAQVRYALNSNSTVYLRPTWNTEIAPSGSKETLAVAPGRSATKMGDTIVGWTEKNILNWGEGASLNGYTRYYLPTAESNRATGQRGMFYARGNVDMPVNSWLKVWFDTKLWWALQSRNYYVDPANSKVLKANFDKEVNPYFTAVVRLNKYFNFYQSLGFDYTWMHGHANSFAPQEYDMGYFDTSIGTSFFSNVDLRIGFNDEPALNVAASPKLISPTEYYYYFWFAVSI